MFRCGDEISDPATGTRFVFRRTAAETEGTAIVLEIFLPPGGLPSAEHVHPHQEQRLQVLSGPLAASVGGRRRIAGPGARFTVPAGSRCRFWNPGDEAVHLVVEISPALALESFVKGACLLTARARSCGRVRPGLLERAVLAALHFDTVRPASPPAPVQRLWLAVAAPLGRALGHRPLPSPTGPGATGSPL